MSVDLKRVSKDTLYIAMFSTVTILIWIGIEVWRAVTKPVPTKVNRQLLEPLPDGLNLEVFQDIKQRIKFDEAELINLPKPEKNQEVTNSAKTVSMEKITASPAATSGGSQ